MSLYINLTDAFDFCEEALKTQIKYHVARKRLHDAFTASVSANPDRVERPALEIKEDDVDSLYSTFDSRNDELSDDKKLSFRKAVSRILRDARNLVVIEKQPVQKPLKQEESRTQTIS